MNLGDMRTIVRRDLHDEDSGNYRWTNDELDRHIAHTVKDLSEAIPYEQKATKATTSASREIDISSITDRVMVQAVEYPVGQFPRRFQRFALWGDTVTLLGPEVPDGSNAYIYYGKLHTLDVSTSTIASPHDDLVAAGACGYAAVEWAVYAINRVNVGGTRTPEELLSWGRERLTFFRGELRRLGRRNRVRVRALYAPYYPPVSESTDYGP
ncbi:MAG: hypothetical protein H8D49_01780 [Dehalococcoidia bacterium]|nr:hypothetical protein [Dehalococcoidia bacterium]MBL7166688.1 hypothetical protein [Dehalococcoidales bacterium]